MIPKTLTDIQNFLIEQKINFSTPLKDGRLNSSFNEDEIIKLIKTKFTINEPNSRQWFDFSFEENGVFYPVNIKVTTTNTADNLNCKLGIYYCLTGMMPDFSNGVDWLTYFEKLKENIGKNKNRDYYFLICSKEEDKDIFIGTLKQIKKLQPNGNNLPFQCKWNDNKIMKKRSFEESRDYILRVFGESIKLRADIYFNFKRLFGEYI